MLRELESLMPRLEAMVRRGPCKEGSDSRKAGVSAWRTQACEDVAAGRIDTALRAEEAPPSLQNEYFAT